MAKEKGDHKSNVRQLQTDVHQLVEQPVDDARQGKVKVMKRACRNEAPGACRTEEHPETEHPGKIRQDRPALLRSCLAAPAVRAFSDLRDHSAKPESTVVVVRACSSSARSPLRRGFANTAEGARRLHWAAPKARLRGMLSAAAGRWPTGACPRRLSHTEAIAGAVAYGGVTSNPSHLRGQPCPSEGEDVKTYYCNSERGRGWLTPRGHVQTRFRPNSRTNAILATNRCTATGLHVLAASTERRAAW